MVEAEPVSREKPLNIAEVFRHTYIFSQGEPRLQIHMFNWLARTLMRGMPAPTYEQINPGKLAAYGSAESIAGGHKLISGPFSADAQLNAQRFQKAMETGGQERLPPAVGWVSRFNEPTFPKQIQDWSDDDCLRAILYNLIEVDYRFLVDQGGRPTNDERRDRWSSFIIDFGLLQRGTGPWKWSSVPEPLKRMWDAAMERLKTPIHPLDKSFVTFPHYTLLLDVIRVYLHTHPDLPPDDRAKIEQFRQQVVDTALSFAQEYGHANPSEDISWFRRDVLKAANPSAP